MPLSVNVGLSRKASENYQSSGVSINVTAELDQSLLARPAELQQQIDDLYQQAQQALDRQTRAPSPSPDPEPEPQPQPTPRRAPPSARPNEHARTGDSNGHRRSSSNGSSASGMTDSRRKAILAISRRLNLDPLAECRDILGAQFDHLTLRQASELIDHLKGMQQPAGSSPHGGGR